MKKVILNKCFGGFKPSRKAYELYAKKKGLELYLYELHINNQKTSYHKVNKSDSIFTMYLTKDYGNVVDSINNKDRLYLDDSHREDATLIEVVEELGYEASSYASLLKIVEIPDDLDYVIDNYDGIETLHQRVQEW